MKKEKQFRVYYNVVKASSHLFSEVYAAKDEQDARRLFRKANPDEHFVDREVIEVKP
jgi:hypothetical protein